jgi:hypothetical protein
MGCTTSVPWRSSFPTWNHSSAGCMFVGPRHVLLGLHTTRKSEVRMSGLGGKKEAGESWYATAIRETVEELFHVSVIPTPLFAALEQIRPLRVFFEQESRYVCIVYVLQDLPRFLKICRRFLQSPLYSSFPRSVEELVYGRAMNAEAEIMQLVVWPHCVPNRRFRITKDLMEDLTVVRNIFNGPTE